MPSFDSSCKELEMDFGIFSEEMMAQRVDLPCVSRRHEFLQSKTLGAEEINFNRATRCGFWYLHHSSWTMVSIDESNCDFLAVGKLDCCRRIEFDCSQEVPTPLNAQMGENALMLCSQLII